MTVYSKRSVPGAISLTRVEMRSKEEDDAGAKELARADALRPKTRGECEDGPRPCPWIACKYHLAVDVTVGGGLKINFPHLALEDMPATCALDEAAKDGMRLETVGKLMNLTRERVRQIERLGLSRMGLTGRRLLR